MIYHHFKANGEMVLKKAKLDTAIHNRRSKLSPLQERSRLREWIGWMKEEIVLLEKMAREDDVYQDLAPSDYEQVTGKPVPERRPDDQTVELIEDDWPIK